MIRRPPRSTRVRSSAASDVYKRQLLPLEQLAKEPSGRMGVAISLNQDVDHPHEDLVQVPHVAEPALAMPELPGILRSELPTPLPDGLVGDDDAPLREEFFDVAETHSEPMV